MEFLILIPAAGASTRMRGRDKLLEEVDGVPQLRRITDAALATGQHVLVALPSAPGERGEVLSPLEGSRLTVLPVADAAEGMGATLRAAASWILTAGAPRPTMILPADMPELEAKDLQHVMSRYLGGAIRACAEDGRPGHPVILPPHSISLMVQLHGDEGARSLLSDQDVRRVPLKGQRAVIDLDTPEDWATWRAGSGR